MLKAIEEIGWESGMRLNKGKCELLLFGNNANVHFKNKEKVKRVDRAKYLGCTLNQHNNMEIEVKGRIREAMGTLKQMHTFWRHSNCTVRFKINVIQAILFAKVLLAWNRRSSLKPQSEHSTSFI